MFGFGTADLFRFHPLPHSTVYPGQLLTDLFSLSFGFSPFSIIFQTISTLFFVGGEVLGFGTLTLVCPGSSSLSSDRPVDPFDRGGCSINHIPCHVTLGAELWTFVLWAPLGCSVVVCVCVYHKLSVGCWLFTPRLPYIRVSVVPFY